MIPKYRVFGRNRLNEAMGKVIGMSYDRRSLEFLERGLYGLEYRW